VSLVLDAGGLLILEKNDREAVAVVKGEYLAGRPPRTHGGVIGQVWRGGSGQANLARLLKSIDIEPLDDLLGRRAGALLGKTRTKDVIDAAVVLLARDEDQIWTSDTDDLSALAEASEIHLELIPV